MREGVWNYGEGQWDAMESLWRWAFGMVNMMGERFQRIEHGYLGFNLLLHRR